MKASDYIVEYLIKKGITDVFGYPGGTVTHLMDSFSKYENQITSHLNYNEQGAAMAACGYAQVSGKCGVAYATSGPGATNLVTGICNAYMDSIPTVFFTGQVNSFEQKGNLRVRQRGFQETDIVSIVKPITKYAIQVNDVSMLRSCLDKAFYFAEEGRKGPVLLDIAMDVSRSNIEVLDDENCVTKEKEKEKEIIDYDSLISIIKYANRPVILIGNGLAKAGSIDNSWKDKINELNIPVVSSMISVDVQNGLSNYFGFIGAYGNRTANFIVSKSDLVISIGSRLDIRQVGAVRNKFAPKAQIIRVDIDPDELSYKVHKDDVNVLSDAVEFINNLHLENAKKSYCEWINVCKEIFDKLLSYDERNINKIINRISDIIPENSIITTDVGQNQVWVAQSFNVKKNQRILFSGGHGAMGYSLPASIGAAVASNSLVYSFNGDGGIQMNIQELQCIIKEHLPIKIIVINNKALGMIRHFQEMYFSNNYFQTVPENGFVSPNFSKIAEAYGFDYYLISNECEISNLYSALTNNLPAFIEIMFNENTYVYPKLKYGNPIQDQEPLIDRILYNELMEL